MKKLRLLWRILQTTQADKIMLGFTGFVFFTAFIISVVEPNINTYGDGLWYCFAVFTTIGFGDLIAVTMIGRIMTIILGLYGILVVALIPGIIVSYFSEVSKARANKSIIEFLDSLERLPDLSKEELTKISISVKKNRNKL
ncbi:MAG: potassium channel family protein [Coprobacillus sp.]